jgi:probable phosphoglycerate mutase
LTDIGKLQAKSLGERWSNVRIDAICSSDMNRAMATAAEIVNFHSSKLQLETNNWFREQDVAGWENHERPGLNREDARGYAAHGREPLDYVVNRSLMAIVILVRKYGIYLRTPPTELFGDSHSLTDPSKLPDNVPHIVIVSHNILLSELYEALFSWTAEKHVNLGIEYANTGW